ncbi:MAG: aromatic ring-hydroxylating dioxygenase subunit alpha [Actinomycetota bacterium]
MSAREHRRGLEARYYTDPEVFRRELDLIFGHTWVMVGHVSQVAAPGDLITAQVGDENVVIANDGGEIGGFYNVCQHRGHELVPHAEVRGAKSITCPYHAWSYDLGGRLVHARGEQVGELCVPRIRVDDMGGFLFANLDPDAPSLEDTVPGIEAELLAIAPDAGERVLSSRRTHLIDANWKIAVENYNECYHCPNVHKAFTAGVVSPGSYRITPKGNCIHHTAEGPDEAKSGYTRHGDGNDYGSFFTWPVSSIQCYPGRVLNTFRWVPLSVDRTLLIREWWFDREDPTKEQQEVIELDWTTTVAEDFDLMDSVQRGVSSRGYRPGPLIESADGVATVHTEDTVPHLHSLLRSALGEA